MHKAEEDFDERYRPPKGKDKIVEIYYR